MMAYKVVEDHPNATDKSFVPCAKVMGHTTNAENPIA